MELTKSNLLEVVANQRLDASFYQEMVRYNDCVPLKALASVKGGKRIPKGKDFSSVKTNYLYLRLSDIDDVEQINYENLKYISEELFKQLARYEVKENELVISIAGTIGKVFLVKNIPNDKKVILTENCAKIELKKNDIQIDYLKIILNLEFVQSQINRSRIKTTIPKLGLDKIGKLQIPITSITTQRNIIDIYNKALKEKQAKEREAKELLGSIDAYISATLNVDIPAFKLQDMCYKVSIADMIGGRYDAYYHNPYFEDAFKKLRATHYSLVRLKNIAKLITSGITPIAGGNDYTTANDGIAFIRSGDININGNIDFDNLLYIKPEIHNGRMRSSQVKNNDIMIAIVGATIGQVGIYNSDREANINQAIALVRLKEGYNPEYVKEVIKSSIGQLSLNRLKRPVARANINLDEIASIMLPIPDIEKQTDIVNHIWGIRKKAETLQEESLKLLETAKLQIEQMILK